MEKKDLVPVERGEEKRLSHLERAQAAGALSADDQLKLQGVLEDLAERAEQLAEAQHAEHTRRAYGHDVDVFAAWCFRHGACPLPATAAVVRAFVTAEDKEGKGPGVIMRRMAAIAHNHRRHGHASPIHAADAGPLKATLLGIRRKHAGRPKRKKRPADARLMRELLDTVKGDGVREVRDRAILALGMSAAMRRSELVALVPDDIGIVSAGLRISIGRSKTDQMGEGQVIAVPEGSKIKPKQHLLAWIEVSGILAEGKPLPDPGTGERPAPSKLFRRLTPKDLVTPYGMSDKAIERIVKKAAADAGYPPSEFAGHSLRSGFLTEAAATGASIFKMQEVSRHRSVQVLSDYVRDADRFKNHAGERFI